MAFILSSSFLAVCLAALFCSAAQGEDGVLKFMMVGDWGGQTKKPYYTESETRIADQMGKTAADIGANFTIAVGDNFYDNGVTDVDDKRFKETFEVRKDPSECTVVLQTCTATRIKPVYTHFAR